MIFDLGKLEEKLPDYLAEQGITTKQFHCLDPEHEDKNASASIFFTRGGRYVIKCFGCNKVFSIFDAAHHLEGLPAQGSPNWFIGTVKLLADRYGIELPNAISSPILEIYRKVISLGEVYPTSSSVKRVIEQRKLPLEIKIPLLYEEIVSILRQDDFDPYLIRLAGIDETRFNPEWTIFPLYSPGNIVVGFNTRRNDNNPKYITTPNNAVFTKGSYLYGLFFDIKPHEPIWIVEGQKDVLALWSKGYQAVCPLGTALTSEQIDLLIRRGLRRVILCFDGDEAGRKANLKAIEKLFEKGLIPNVVSLPDEEDPHSCTEKKISIPSSVSAIEYFMFNSFDDFKQEDGVTKALELIATVPSAAKRERLIQEISPLLDLTVEALLSDLEAVRRRTVEHEDRFVLSKVEEALEKGRKNPEGILEFLREATESICEIRVANYQQGNQKAIEALENIRQNNFKLFERDIHFREKGLRVISDLLHENGLGWLSGTLFVVAGDEQTGKTTFMVQIAVEALLGTEDSHVIYHSTDDSIGDLVPRFIASIVRNPNFTYRDAMGTEEILLSDKRTEAGVMANKTLMRWFQEDRLILVDASETRKIASNEAQIDILRKKNPNCKIILINDNMHRNSDFAGVDDNTKQDLMSGFMKNLAVRKGISIWATAEYRKKKDLYWQRGNDDIAGDRALKYHASVIFHLYNDINRNGGRINKCVYVHEYKNQLLPRVRLTVGKNKVSGKIGELYFDMFPASGFFINVDARKAWRDRKAREEELGIDYKKKPIEEKAEEQEEEPDFLQEFDQEEEKGECPA